MFVVGRVKRTQLNERYQDCCQSEAEHMLIRRVRQVSEFLDAESSANANAAADEFFLSDETLAKSLNTVDLVSDQSTRTSCFTKK